MTRPQEMMNAIDKMATQLAEYSRELTAWHLTTVETIALGFCVDNLRNQLMVFQGMAQYRHRPSPEERKRVDDLLNGEWIEDEEQPS